MVKKFILLIVMVGLIGGGFFYWWKNQTDVGKLNETLPEGIKVAKSLFGEEYRVINEIDGYEFNVPLAWKGVRIIEYIPERTEGGYTASSIGVEGKDGGNRIIAVDRYKFVENVNNIKFWAETNFATFEFVGEFTEDKVGEFDIVKTQENVHLGGMSVYFFQKDDAIYAITNGSEQFIEYIILNGKW